MSRAELGIMGERLIVRWLLYLGWWAVLGGVSDITALSPNGKVINIEVKTARKNKDGKWRFTLYKRNHTNHRVSDYVILIAIGQSSSIFVIPTNDIKDRTSIAITSNPKTYAGKFAAYRVI